jgi:hypothetical protein
MLAQVFSHNPGARLQFDGRDGHDYEISRVDGQYVISQDGEVQEGMTPLQVFNNCFGADTGRTILFETLSRLKTHFGDVAEGNRADVSQLVSDQWARQTGGGTAPTAPSSPGGSSGPGNPPPVIDDSWANLDWSWDEPVMPEVTEIAPVAETDSGVAPILSFSVAINPEQVSQLYAAYHASGGERAIDFWPIKHFICGFGFPNCTASITVDLHGLEERIGSAALEQEIARLRSTGDINTMISLLTSPSLRPGDAAISIQLSNGRQIDVESFRSSISGIWQMSQEITTPPLASIFTVRTA